MSQMEFFRTSRRSSRYAKIPFIPSEDIINYLKSPIKSGIWLLTFRNTNLDKLPNKLKDFIATIDSKDKTIQPYLDRLLKYSGTFSIDTVISFLNYLNALKKKRDNNASRQNHNVFRIASFIEQYKLKTKLVAYFVEELEIYDKLYDSINLVSTVSRPDDGELWMTEPAITTILCSDNLMVMYGYPPTDDEQLNISIYSTNVNELEKFSSLLTQLGLTDDVKLKAVFSPEQELLQPYFHILINSFAGIAHIDKYLLIEAYERYNEKKYNYAVSNIGIILEDLLVHIYETLFREKVDRTALGPLVDLIYKKILPYVTKFRKVSKSETEQDIVCRLDEYLKSGKKNSRDLAAIFRSFISVYTKSNKGMLKLINEQKNNKTISVFPSNIKESIGKLTHYRNLAAHKTENELNSYDTVRAVCHLVAIIMWWVSEEDLINWKTSQEDIINSILSRSGNKI